MAIVNKLQIETDSERKAAMRRYLELLRGTAEGPKEIDELKRLMVCLNKTAAETERDHKVLAQIATHRQTMRTARMVFPRIAPAEDAVKSHENETASLLAKRKETATQLQQELGSVYQVYSAGVDAAETINQLKVDFPDLLADEPATKESELKMPV